MNRILFPRRRRRAAGRHRAAVASALAAAPAAGSAAAACLRVFDGQAEETGVQCLHGLPGQVGITRDGEGRRHAGVTLAVTPDRADVITSASAEWWDALIAAASQARDDLVYGDFAAVERPARLMTAAVFGGVV